MRKIGSGARSLGSRALGRKRGASAGGRAADAADDDEESFGSPPPALPASMSTSSSGSSLGAGGRSFGGSAATLEQTSPACLAGKPARVLGVEESSVQRSARPEAPPSLQPAYQRPTGPPPQPPKPQLLPEPTPPVVRHNSSAGAREQPAPRPPEPRPTPMSPSGAEALSRARDLNPDAERSVNRAPRDAPVSRVPLAATRNAHVARHTHP